MKLKAGSKIENRYTIVAELGEGGFATVYRAHDEMLDRYVAIKVLKVMDHSDSDVKRFLQEAQILSRLSHKNIVSIYSCGILPDSTPYVVMEFLKGRSLQSMLIENSKLDYQLIKTLVIQCCDALIYAHKSGVIHRDISPTNIYLSTDSDELNFRLLDFGLSKLVNQQAESLTETGLLLGNPLYMSPEQAAGENVDSRTDIYSLGCVVYQCASGEPPFVADNPLSLLFLHRNSFPKEPQLDWVDSTQREQMKDLILHCIQKKPNNRFASCDELRTFLETGQLAENATIKQKWTDQRNEELKPLRGGKSVRQIALTILSLSALVYLAWYSPLSDSILSRSTLFVPTETAEQLASFFLQNKKAETAQLIYEELSQRPQTDTEQMIKIEYSLCSIDVQLKSTEQLVQHGNSLLRAIKEASNNSVKREYLKKTWDLLLPYSPSESVKEFTGLQLDVASQMLACRPPDIKELRFCYSKLVIWLRDLPGKVGCDENKFFNLIAEFFKIAPPKQVNSICDAVLAFCKQSSLGRQEIRQQLNHLADLIEATGLCSVAEQNKLEVIRLSTQLYENNDDAFKMARKLIQSKDTEHKLKRALFENMIQLYLYNNDIRRALMTCEQSIDVHTKEGEFLYSGIESSVHFQQKEKRIELLYRLGENQKVSSETDKLIAEIMCFEIQSSQPILDPRNLPAAYSLSNKTPGDDRRILQNHVADLLNLLVKTKQSEKIEGVLNSLYKRVQESNWGLDQSFKESLRALRKEVKGSSAIESINRCLSIRQN